METPAMNSGLLGIYETHLTVRDLDCSVRFYQDKIGLELARVIPERNVAFFWVGGKDAGMLGLWAGSGPMNMQLHFAFRAGKDTVLEACDRLQAQGIQPLGFNGEAVTEPVVIGWMPALSIYFKDPDGHSIEFLHLLDEPSDQAFGVQAYSRWRARGRGERLPSRLPPQFSKT